MARVKFGASISGIRGTVGGLTFSANAASAYVRAWRMPVRKRTALQQAPRAGVSGSGARWRALTSGQRSDWNAWAADPAQVLYDAFGDPYYVSGWNWFVGVTQWAATAAQSEPTDAPTAARPGIPSISSVEVDSTGTGTVTISFAAGEFDGLWPILALSVTTDSAAERPAIQQVRFFAGTEMGASDDECIIANISAKLGYMTAGQAYAWRVYAQNTESNRGACVEGRGVVV